MTAPILDPSHELPQHPAKPQTAEIWRTFWILLVATAIEFIIAFTLTTGIVRVSIFLGLTVIKAFYIVGNFMHLRHEQKTLIWCIVLPIVFIMWAIVVFMAEGASILQVR